MRYVGLDALDWSFDEKKIVSTLLGNFTFDPTWQLSPNWNICFSSRQLQEIKQKTHWLKEELNAIKYWSLF